MKLRNLTKVLGTFGLIVALAGTTQIYVQAGETEKTEDQENTDKDNKIRIGVQAGHVQEPLAEINGYFEEEGVDAELVTFTYGAPEIEAITSGDIDFALTGDLPVYSGIANGVDLTLIGSYNSSDTVNSLVVRSDADIHDFSDLKGKTVSVPFGSNVQPLLYEYLEAGGLTEADVEIINLTCADAVTSLESGDIQAAVIWEPFITQAIAEDGIERLADTKDFRTFVCPISGRTEYLKEHPDTVAAALRALQKAADYAKENEDEAAKAISDFFGSDNEDAIKIAIETADLSIDLTPEKIEGLIKGAEKCYQYDLLESEINVEDYIDTSYLEKAGLE